MGISAASTYFWELSTAASSLLQSQRQSVSFSTSQKPASATMSLSGRSGPNEDVVSFSIQAIMALAKGQSAQASAAVESATHLTSREVLGSFADVYARHAADGVEGRFYKGCDPDVYTAGMSSDEAASFREALGNRTLKVQTFEDAGIKSDLSETVTYSGGGMSGSLSGGVDMKDFIKTTKHSFYSVDPMFGGYVVSWGGPRS